MGVRRAAKGVGREHQHEIDAEALPVHRAHVADDDGNITAEHVDDHLVADLEAEAVGELLLERDLRRTAVVGGPPLALDDFGAAGHLPGIRQAAVALQHPFGVGRGLEIFNLDAAGGDDAAAQHRHVLNGGLRRLLFEEGAEAIGLGGGNVDEIERRRALGQRRHELAPQIVVDLGNRNQHGQAQTERHHHRRRQSARTVDVGDRESQHGDPGARQTARQSHQSGGDQAQQREHHERGRHENQRHALVVGEPDHHRDQGCDHQHHPCEVTRLRAMPFTQNRFAKQRRDRHVMRLRQRP